MVEGLTAASCRLHMAVLPTSTRRLYIQTCQAEILECLARNILWHIPGAPTRGPNAYPSVFSLHQHPEKHIFQAIYLAESGSLELCASRRRVRAQKLKMHSPPLMLPSPAVPCPQPYRALSPGQKAEVLLSLVPWRESRPLSPGAKARKTSRTHLILCLSAKLCR